jgi:hypothetical protein
MNTRYSAGFALGLIAVLAAITAAREWFQSSPAIPAEEAVVFDPPLVSQLVPLFLPGQARSLEVRLHNLGRISAVVDELHFSCPCAHGRLGDSGALPQTLAPGESIPLRVTVTSTHGERGRVAIRYAVLGRAGLTPIRSGGMAEFVFAQTLNAEPKFITCGTFRRDDPPHVATVEIWSPRELVPHDPIEVDCEDPAISMEFAADSTPQSFRPANLPGENRDASAWLGTLRIVVDPQIAAAQMKADVVVSAGKQEVRIPVVGLVSE